MHLPRARFVLAARRTSCVASAGSVTYLAGGETSRQFAAEFLGFFEELAAEKGATEPNPGTDGPEEIVVTVIVVGKVFLGS
jgi:hypothetical protein